MSHRSKECFMQSKSSVFFLLLLCLSIGFFGCSTTDKVKTEVEDAVEEALNAKNTAYVDPNRMADAKKEEVSSAKTNTLTEVGIDAQKEISATTTQNVVLTIVNNSKNFAIVDFGVATIPAEGSELTVYRAGQSVGSIRLTPPIKPPLAAADILTGTLQQGDIVKLKP
jgi:hypothetical protein